MLTHVHIGETHCGWQYRSKGEVKGVEKEKFGVTVPGVGEPGDHSREGRHSVSGPDLVPKYDRTRGAESS